MNVTKHQLKQNIKNNFNLPTKLPILNIKDNVKIDFKDQQSEIESNHTHENNNENEKKIKSAQNKPDKTDKYFKK